MVQSVAKGLTELTSVHDRLALTLTAMGWNGWNRWNYLCGPCGVEASRHSYLFIHINVI